MDGKTFVSMWNTDMDPLIQYDKDVLLRCNISVDMANALSVFGLPSDAAPFLSFEASPEMVLSKKFKLPKKYEKLIYFGFTGLGDFICFDTEKSIFVIVRHEDKMDTTIMNSSLSALYGCLQCYSDFVCEANQIGGAGAINNGNISKILIDELFKKMSLIDRAATLPSSFWAQEIDLLRQRCKG